MSAWDGLSSGDREDRFQIVFFFEIPVYFAICSITDIESGSKYTYRNNLIPRMAAACRRGVESGKLIYLSMFGHVATCISMSYRPNKSFFPMQQRK
jgi:hypothetical protein